MSAWKHIRQQSAWFHCSSALELEFPFVFMQPKLLSKPEATEGLSTLLFWCCKRKLCCVLHVKQSLKAMQIKQEAKFNLFCAFQNQSTYKMSCILRYYMFLGLVTNDKLKVMLRPWWLKNKTVFSFLTTTVPAMG